MTNQPTPSLAPQTPPVGGIGGSSGSNSPMSTGTPQPIKKFNEPKKIFGIDIRSLGAVLGLTLFLVLAMGGVVIALQQRFTTRQTVVPTQPESRPAAAGENNANCTLAFTVAAVETSPTPTPTPSVTPTPTPSVSPSPSPTPTPSTFNCNTSCTTDAQCQTANAQYVCSQAHGNRCRLDTNRASESCQPATGTYACNSTCTTDAQCQTASSSYVCSQGNCRLNTALTATNCRVPGQTPPPAAVGCNKTCATNQDCANTDHICYNGRCKLDEYVNSETCTPPQVTKGGQPTQPDLPEELPETGAEDVKNWFFAGLGVLGIGALLLFLL